MKPACDYCAGSEISVLEITDLMVRQCTPREILGLLCRYAGQPDERNQIAVFVIEGRNWALAAKGALSRRS